MKEAAATAAAAIAQSKRLKGRSYRAAVERTQAEATGEVGAMAGASSATVADGHAETKQGSAKKSPSGLIPEVVITVRHGLKSLQGGKTSRASTVDDPPSSESDSDAPRQLNRRAATKRTLVLESDEEGGASSEYDAHEEVKLKKSKKVPSSRKKPLKSNTSQSSDYEESSSGQTDSEEESSAAPSDDGSVSSSAKLKPKLKAKTKPKAKISPRTAATSSSTGHTDGDEMDVDDPPSEAKQKGKAKKRKAVGESERPAKKQKRADSDPWKLESKPVQRDWTQMKAPPLEMFHFARKVVDEYTYLDGKIHSLVTRIAAERHWVLSGTPPIHDFGALKTIAAFLNLHLGIDDDAEGQSAEVKKRRREQTGR